MPVTWLLIQAADAPMQRLGLGEFLRKIPPEILGFSYVLAGVFVASCVYGFVGIRRVRNASGAVQGSLRRLGTLDDDARLDGRTLASVDDWRAASQKLPKPYHPLAEEIERELVASLDTNGRRRFRLRNGEGGLWTLERFAGRFVNLDYLDAVPGTLTAIGLVGTFLAIALGLAGLKSENNVITGVDALLGSLGGKFVSSIIALSLALAFQLVDLLLFRRAYTKAHQGLLDAVADGFPTLSPTQQLTDLLETSRRQEQALSNISSDVVNRFSDVFTSNLLPNLGDLLAKSVQTEMGPVLAQVASGIAALDEGIRRLESGKQESIGAELRALTGNLESSLRQALEQMGAQFREALAGNTDDEFKRAAEAMQGSAAVLSGMNNSFAEMQSSMQRIFEEAERRGSRSFEEGEGRTKALNELVERLVAQLGENASSNASYVQKLLVEAVSGLGAKLAEVTGEIERRTMEANEQNQRTSKELLEKVTGAAERTTSETERLLSTIGERAGDFVAAADQLRELRVGVQSVLAETGERVRDMQAAADSFRSVATEASAMTRTLRDAQASQLMTAEITGGIVKSTGEVVERQAAVVRLSQETYGEAARVLDGIDEQLASALQTISTRMQDYNRQVEKNFETIIKTVNARMPELFERLEGLLQQVTEAVEELNDTLRRRS